jgi:membrane protein YqaA with SNARE-associated domain
MAAFTGGVAAAFTLGFFYFVGAVPGGVAAGLPVWLSALTAWTGYSSGAAVMLLLGAPAREWIAGKLRIPVERDPQKWIWKAWSRFGLPGLGLIAPLTIGPQTACILALAIGERPLKTFLSLSLGVVPYCIGFACAIAWGVSIVKG